MIVETEVELSLREYQVNLTGLPICKRGECDIIARIRSKDTLNKSVRVELVETDTLQINDSQMASTGSA
jgi:hypothetical protein